MDFPSTTLRAGNYDMKYRVGRELENEEVVSLSGLIEIPRPVDGAQGML